MTKSGKSHPYPGPALMQSACPNCALDDLCFPRALPLASHTLWPLVKEKRIVLARGEFLFHAGDRQAGMYAVKAGFLKTCMPLADRRSKVVGFHIMGDALGLGALATGWHSTDAIALNGCEVCAITTEKWEDALEGGAESAHVRYLLASEITRVEAHAAVIGTFSAKQRISTFLLEMSLRWESRRYSKSEFLLFMSHKDIGSFLGLTFETVSRTLSYFQSRQWISRRGKNVSIRNMAALKAQIEHAE